MIESPPSCAFRASDAQDKIHRGVHDRQVEIEIKRGRFRRVPTVRTAGRCGINIIQHRKTVCALAIQSNGPGRKVSSCSLFGPKKSRALGAEEPFISGAHQKVSAKFVYVHRYGPARLARIKHKHRSLRVTGRSHGARWPTM
jgi:hypothetical protein